MRKLCISAINLTDNSERDTFCAYLYDLQLLQRQNKALSDNKPSLRSKCEQYANLTIWLMFYTDSRNGCREGVMSISLFFSFLLYCTFKKCKLEDWISTDWRLLIFTVTFVVLINTVSHSCSGHHFVLYSPAILMVTGITCCICPSVRTSSQLLLYHGQSSLNSLTVLA